ncbi:MAG: glycoside hydrolase family 3 C-terminal domain-containing protein [Thermofilaceae archaeon]
MSKKALIAALGVVALLLIVLLRVAPRGVERRAPPQERLELPGLLVEGRELARRVAEEGVVLLKNDGVLPLNPKARIAVFGTGQNVTWWYHAGGSSFVPLDSRRVVTLLEALLEYGLAVDEEVSRAYSATSLPARTNEMPFTEDEVRRFAERNDVALIVLSRYTSEDFDLPRRGGWFSAGWWFQYYTEQLSGSYYFRGYELEDDELQLIKTVARYFERVVLILNTPHALGIAPVVDDVDAILWVGYPGEMGGYAVANVLLGRVSPSGKLPFTWARSWEDYPSSRCWGSVDVVYCEGIYVGYRYFDTFNVDPLFPFGFGLSYTSFRIDVERVELRGTRVALTVKVANVGGYDGKEVVQVYVTPPAGRLEKEHQRLVAFAKTDLLKPGESQTLRISFDMTSAASFDEEEGAWILEEGVYLVRVGNSSRSTQVVAKVVLPRRVVVERASIKLGSDYFHRRARELGVEVLRRGPDVKPWSYPGERAEIEGAPTLTLDPGLIRERVGTLPPYFPPELSRPDVGETITMRHVVEGAYTLEELVGQMSVEELIDVTIGLRGSAAPSLAARRIPELRQTDGPNGAKLWLPGNLHGTAFPGASSRAATWNLALEYEVGRQIGRELLWAGISLWLAPGLNLHRNPLCGRNAEYYSEDPLLAGTMAAAAVKGLQGNQGVGATLKHFVANDQEAYRYVSDSIVSERALREIYLKAFEIAVRTARPWAVMTSYNKLNGVYTGNYFELCTVVLRGEWGFDGLVMTDWWSASYNYKAYAAGNDALMPYTEYVPWAPHTAYNLVVGQVKEALWNGTLTLGQLQRSAYNILRVALRSRALANMLRIRQEEIYVYEPPPDYFEVERTPG